MCDYLSGVLKPVGILKINSRVNISIYGKMPNRFHRWMARVLLGWEYQEIEDAFN